MRKLMALLLLGCVACIASAISGVQAFHSDSRTGTVVAYWHGYGRWLALAYAAIFAVAFYGVYRRVPIAWKIGWICLMFSTAHFIFEAWFRSIHQPSGWVGAIGDTMGGILVFAYFGIWWQRQREYFSPDGPPAGWSPDLAPLRWFGICMFCLGLAGVFVILVLHAFHVI